MFVLIKESQTKCLHGHFGHDQMSRSFGMDQIFPWKFWIGINMSKYQEHFWSRLNVYMDVLDRTEFLLIQNTMIYDISLVMRS